MKFVLGIDGGGSKIACLAANDEGQLLGYGRGGPVNTNYVLRQEAVESAGYAVQAALEAASLRGEQIDTAVVSAPIDPASLDQVARQCNLKHIERAAEGATSRWAARFWINIPVGIAVDAGTGSLARGWAQDGREVGAGGFGATVGDEGSGFWISMKAICAVLQAHDGRLENTRLTQPILNYFGLSVIHELPFRVSGGFISTDKLLEMSSTQDHLGVMIDSGQIQDVDTSPASNQSEQKRQEKSQGGLTFHQIQQNEPLARHTIASLCPVVVETARQGDRIALQILQDAGRELGRLAVAVIRRLEMEDETFAIVPFGGVFKAGELILGSFREFCLTAAPHATIVLPSYEPEVGAVLIALEKTGARIDECIIETIQQSSQQFPACCR